MTSEQRLLKIFHLLLAAFGKRHWWPGETDLEIAVGAILTQNTSWKNVEKAINSLKWEGLLNVHTLQNISEKELGEVIRSSGFYNVKSRRLKSFINVIHERFNGKISNLSNLSTEALREILLGIDGIGPETADSILLYALNRPVFVVDAYTKRFLSNHRLHRDHTTYDDVQRWFMMHLPCDTYLFNEFHALIVYLGQNYCRKKPMCNGCPLEEDLKEYPQQASSRK